VIESDSFFLYESVNLTVYWNGCVVRIVNMI